MEVSRRVGSLATAAYEETCYMEQVYATNDIRRLTDRTKVLHMLNKKRRNFLPLIKDCNFYATTDQPSIRKTTAYCTRMYDV